MKIESYRKIMSYLDVIEAELNKVAKAVGHVSYEEFMAESAEQAPALKKAA